MARTYRRRPERRYACFRNRLQTYGQRRDLQAMEDQCVEEGLDLSGHKRYLPSSWDDIPISAYREGRWRQREEDVLD